MLKNVHFYLRKSYFIVCLLVLCGLFVGLSIAGFCPRLLAAELIFEDAPEEEVVLDAPEEEVVLDVPEEEEVLDVPEEEEVPAEVTVEVDIDYDQITAAVVAALDDSSYNGSISSTYQSLFAGAFYKFASIGDDYLLYRSDQYTYIFVIGDLTLSGTVFTGDDCTVITYVTANTGSYSYAWSVSSDSVSVDASLAYSYSNLGDYMPLPDLMSSIWDVMQVLALVFVGLCVFIHGLVDLRGCKS